MKIVSPKIGSTYRHAKRGTEYTILTIGKDSTNGPTDNRPTIAYSCRETGQVYFRALDQFTDGRFELVSSAPDRADSAEHEAAYLRHLIDDVTTKASAVTVAYASEGVLIDEQDDKLIDALRDACNAARAYAGLNKTPEGA